MKYLISYVLDWTAPRPEPLTPGERHQFFGNKVLQLESPLTSEEDIRSIEKKLEATEQGRVSVLFFHPLV